ncbi:MAG: hypothetical protein ABGW88_00970 [Leeuwenhoekiella sp.]|jgi:3-methyladenine DNA glycosylase Tag|uniref:Thrombospondin type 3 repeat-containing protein n=3 Tax=Leeuwenhoekiella marinoflava TaxID=988 RepID=A0A4V1KSW9_9FLAO|nr:hypothetical protein [Leeuwenhoekiella blandensis]MBQ50694.1 hypothetical protein [Leeuwenhoekiella sp.]RXG33198.1 hypothetical protein DSL99_294 [Leeuwenhoekiella marinoflava]SHE42238.1 hypothetical protein SAMN02745246_00352 [Leeuwenhoekiella marinoflava DSM 3653]HCW63978.1 hypothetical protein [Leeuwenhoekiella sp.]|tara:strand:- start:5358 stop:5588 length:231 start_codon:yes stop_codon:yes gene_type:complete
MKKLFSLIMLGVFTAGLNANAVSSKGVAEDDTFSCYASEQVPVNADCDGDGRMDYEFMVCPEYAEDMALQLLDSCG